MDIQKFREFVLNKAGERSIEPVVILFGKKEVRGAGIYQIPQLSRLLSKECPDFTFRAGNQIGADAMFVSNIRPEKLQICPPYDGHREINIPDGAAVFPADQISIPKPALYYLKGADRGLYNAFRNGRNDRLFYQSHYLLRNLAMIYGFTKDDVRYPQASFGLYWDNLADPKNGGTGFTCSACVAKGVSIFNQNMWSKWLEND